MPNACEASICPLGIAFTAPRKTSVEYAAQIIPTQKAPTRNAFISIYPS